MNLEQEALQAQLSTPETTQLTPDEEQQFRVWLKQAGITDADSPQSRYDYRGYWKDVASKGEDQRKGYDDGPHFPDTYKQHGHPSFSVESRYSSGPADGGRWVGEDYVPHGADAMATSRTNSDPEFLRKAIQALVQNLPRRIK